MDREDSPPPSTLATQIWRRWINKTPDRAKYRISSLSPLLTTGTRPSIVLDNKRLLAGLSSYQLEALQILLRRSVPWLYQEKVDRSDTWICLSQIEFQFSRQRKETKRAESKVRQKRVNAKLKDWQAVAWIQSNIKQKRWKGDTCIMSINIRQTM